MPKQHKINVHNIGDTIEKEKSLFLGERTDLKELIKNNIIESPKDPIKIAEENIKNLSTYLMILGCFHGQANINTSESLRLLPKKMSFAEFYNTMLSSSRKIRSNGYSGILGTKPTKKRK